MLSLDSRDQCILTLLRDNARMSVVDIAKKLNLSRATVQNRIQRLEQSGVILGYTVRLGSDLEKPPVSAQMCIRTESAKEADVIKSLRGNPNVSTVHHTTGHWDLIAEIQADDLATFNAIIGALRLIEGVTATETNLLLDTYQ